MPRGGGSSPNSRLQRTELQEPPDAQETGEGDAVRTRGNENQRPGARSAFLRAAGDAGRAEPHSCSSRRPRATSASSWSITGARTSRMQEASDSATSPSRWRDSTSPPLPPGGHGAQDRLHRRSGRQLDRVDRTL